MKTDSGRVRKATFVLEERLLGQLKEAVKTTGAKSVNALVKRAIAEFLDQVQRAQRKELYRQAAADPLFLADVHDVERDFAQVDSEMSQDR